MLRLKHIRINYIDPETQEHNTLSIAYQTDFVLNAFISKHSLIVKEKFDISSSEFLHTPEAHRMHLFSTKNELPEERIRLKEEAKNKPKKKGLIRRLFGV